MNAKEMNEKVDRVLEDMDATELEERIAPVDCAKKPNHPECQAVSLYGVVPPYSAPSP